jgi:hypothetical protein
VADDLVQVANFRFVSEAEAARLFLQDEGISAFLADAETVTMDWFLGNAVGYIKLVVPTSHAPRAAELIAILREKQRARREASSDESEAGACLSCGAEMTEEQTTCPACGWSYSESDEA